MVANEPFAQPLAGKKVYSAGVIAGYTLLGNIPVGCILYGLNLRARGAKGFGLVSLVFGLVSMAALLLMIALDDTPQRPALLLNVLAAAGIYGLEKRPADRALQLGAQRARWWPPGLFLTGAITLVVGVLYLVEV